ncbi:MAG: hypothetical protein J6N67_06140 [Desulfovibrio sp.]|nr:hypothetical protein [Desulfovibrio desulfuricans]MBO5490577.1 hypothetical protein [Desulfovibrio sp.]MBO6171722.1 hypothetical protein [Desulfovibrio sp.]
MCEKRGYLCPACGKSTTSVIQTASLSSCVIRTRRCLTCGHIHETTEIAVDTASALREAVRVLAEHLAARTANRTEGAGV